MKRNLCMVCVFVCALLLLASCTPTAPANTPAPAATPAPDAAPAESTPAAQPEESAGQPIDLRFSWWGSDVRHQASLAAIDKYMELNPNVRISGEYGGWDGYYEKLVTQLAGNSMPDVMQVSVSWFTEFMRRDPSVFPDLRNVPQIDTNGYDAAMLDGCMRNGVLVGLPTGIICEKWFGVNLEFFSKFDLDPTAEFTWDSLHEAGVKVKAQDPNAYLMFSGEDDLVVQLETYHIQRVGDTLVHDDFSVHMDQAAMEEYLTLMVKMFDDGVYYPFEQTIGVAEVENTIPWQEGNVGMFLNALSALPNAVESSPFEMGEMTPPILADAKNTGVWVHPAQIMSLYGRSPHMAEAAEFLNWFMSDTQAAEILKDTRGIPSNNNSREVLEKMGGITPLMASAVEKCLVKAGMEPGDVTTNEEIAKIIRDIVGMVAYKRVTPAEGAQQIVEQVTAKAAELKAAAGLA